MLWLVVSCNFVITAKDKVVIEPIQFLYFFVEYLSSKQIIFFILESQNNMPTIYVSTLLQTSHRTELNEWWNVWKAVFAMQRFPYSDPDNNFIAN